MKNSESLKEFKKLNSAQITEKIDQLRKDLIELRFKQATRQLNETHKFKIIKKMKSDPAVKNEFNSSNESLEKYGIDLTQSAREGILDPVIGRDEEIRRTIQILSRRTKNNPVLIGEPGVGKTAIAEGLAQRIQLGDIPDILEDKRVLTLDIGLLVAGTKYIDDKIVSSGGRVLNVTSIGNNFLKIRKKIISNIKRLNWKNGFYRSDIGWKVINKNENYKRHFKR